MSVGPEDFFINRKRFLRLWELWMDEVERQLKETAASSLREEPGNPLFQSIDDKFIEEQLEFTMTTLLKVIVHSRVAILPPKDGSFVKMMDLVKAEMAQLLGQEAMKTAVMQHLEEICDELREREEKNFPPSEIVDQLLKEMGLG